MYPEILPTEKPEALRSFIEGRELFQTYLETGGGDELQHADDLFAEAEKLDPGFQLATFFHAVSRTELRDSDWAIERLNRLVEGGAHFLPEIYVHLAYAHTKKYTDKDYIEAKRTLEKAESLASKEGKRGLEHIIQAYRVFLYAVMGGRLKEGDGKEYLQKALDLGFEVLQNPAVSKSPHFPFIESEVHNALGIAYMWKGERAEGDAQSESGKKAEEHYQFALRLGRNTVRVLQNLGTLRKLRAEKLLREGRSAEAQELFRAAIDSYSRSIEINPRDQFPHYRLAELHVRTRDWDKAKHYWTLRRRESGAVKERDWQRVLDAIEKMDSSLLDRTLDKS